MWTCKLGVGKDRSRERRRTSRVAIQKDKASDRKVNYQAPRDYEKTQERI